MMICYRFVRLIETHADTLAAGLEKKVLSSAYATFFRTIPAHELRERVYEIYRHLGDWLLGKNQVTLAVNTRSVTPRGEFPSRGGFHEDLRTFSEASG